MARIRTIKPEFWTDEKVVQLPFEARLLFIGLWNFADDDGYLPDEPERIQLQVLPADQVDCDLLLDLLVAAELLEKLDLSDGRTALRISGFDRHQKISHKTPTKLPISGAKKRSVSTPVRREIALKYGCPPGEALEVSCYYCGSPGSIHWFRLRNGRPSSWVAFGGMEIDHFTPEAGGGETKAENLVLSCRYCNRSKGAKDGISFISKALPNPPEISRELSPDLGREGKGKESSSTKKKAREKPWGKAPDGVDPDAWAEWTAYKGGRPKAATVTKLRNLLAKHSPETQRKAVEHSIANGYAGLFPEKFADVQTTNRTPRNAVFEQPHERRARELAEAVARAEGASGVGEASGDIRGQVYEGVWERSE